MPQHPPNSVCVACRREAQRLWRLSPEGVAYFERRSRGEYYKYCARIRAARSKAKKKEREPDETS